jgi:protein ImuB
VLARFGFDAAYAHRLAAGKDDRPLAVRSPPPDLAVAGEYDPPLERVDMAAFAARALADRLHERLAAHGLAATRLGIEARTAAGEELHRVWRHDGLLDAAAIADRVRWQLDGWLTGSTTRLRAHGGVFADPDAPTRTDGLVTTAPTAGIDRLRLIPDGLVRCSGMQPGLWGELGEADARAHRALHRVQGLLGPESVYTAVLGGGRGYAERVRLVPWGDERKAEGRDRPWPGRIPAPAPATVLPEPIPVTVCTADGAFLQVDERLALSGPPATVRLPRGSGVGRAGVDGSVASGSGASGSGASGSGASGAGIDRSGVDGSAGAPITVTGWAGPWPVDERWWAPAEANQSVRLQLGLADGSALLVAGRGDTWWLEAVYD